MRRETGTSLGYSGKTQSNTNDEKVHNATSKTSDGKAVEKCTSKKQNRESKESKADNVAKPSTPKDKRANAAKDRSTINLHNGQDGSTLKRTKQDVVSTSHMQANQHEIDSSTKQTFDQCESIRTRQTSLPAKMEDQVNANRESNETPNTDTPNIPETTDSTETEINDKDKTDLCVKELVPFQKQYATFGADFLWHNPAYEKLKNDHKKVRLSVYIIVFQVYLYIT